VERVGLLLRLESGKYEDAARVEWGGLVPLLGGQLKVALGETPCRDGLTPDQT
jgi:hypothetical protein